MQDRQGSRSQQTISDEGGGRPDCVCSCSIHTYDTPAWGARVDGAPKLIISHHPRPPFTPPQKEKGVARTMRRTSMTWIRSRASMHMMTLSDSHLVLQGGKQCRGGGGVKSCTRAALREWC